MGFYKYIINGEIVYASPSPVWVSEDIRGRIVLTDMQYAKGVTLDTGEIVHITGTPKFKTGAYREVSLADITEGEYKEICTLLDLGAKIDDDDDKAVWEEEPAPAEEPIEEADTTLDEVKKRYIAKLSNDCQRAIMDGVDVTLSDDSVQHFSLEIEDQLNLITLSAMVENGETMIPYHASGKLCAFYSAEDITTIINTATAHKTYHTSYFNSLKNWVLSMEDIASVGAVRYGDEIPAEYCSDVLLTLQGGCASCSLE